MEKILAQTNIGNYGTGSWKSSEPYPLTNVRSRLDSAGANKVCIYRIMVHKSERTGERVYTYKNIEELKLNIELFTN